MKHNSRPPHELHFAVLAADTTIFTVRDGRLFVRLIPVHLPPYFLHLAGLPGGLLAPSETADQAATRHSTAKGRIAPEHLYLEQLGTFSAINRDPRGRVVAVAYLGLAAAANLSTTTEGDSDAAWWAPVDRLPKLAYDHREIIRSGVDRLRSRITYTTLIAQLMPREFTLTELEQAYETILGTDIDKRNFRKKVLKANVLQELPRTRAGVQHRPAKLFAFRSRTVEVVALI